MNEAQERDFRRDLRQSPKGSLLVVSYRKPVVDWRTRLDAAGRTDMHIATLDDLWAGPWTGPRPSAVLFEPGIGEIRKKQHWTLMLNIWPVTFAKASPTR